MSDPTNPAHYRQHPSGVECIAITEHMGFCLGNAWKYLWRCREKHADPVFDLKKARWYINREIERCKNGNLENISFGPEIRSQHGGPCADDRESAVSHTVINADRVSSDSIFGAGVEARREVCSSYGFRDIRRATCCGAGSVTSERGSQGQPSLQSQLRDAQAKHGEAGCAPDGLQRPSEPGGASYRGERERDTRLVGERDSISGPLRRDPSDHRASTSRRQLAIDELICQFPEPERSIMELLWRAGLKGSDPIPDLRKARWYIDREIDRLSTPRTAPEDRG